MPIAPAELTSKIDALWTTQQNRKRFEPKQQKGYVSASQGETGKVYAICISEEGKERVVKAEFLSKGRGDFSECIFFRRALKNGKFIIHAVYNYSFIKESKFDVGEKD